MNIEFVKYDEVFLEHSWNWLNDEEVKRLTNTPTFSKENQKDWYNGLSNKDNYLIWGILCDSKPIGVCGLKNITANDGEYWGYIGNKEYWGKGIGKVIMEYIINKSLNLKLQSIWLNVITDNPRAIQLYIKSGFIKDKVIKGRLSIYRLVLKNDIISK